MILSSVFICILGIITVGFLCAESLNRERHTAIIRYLVTSPAVLAVLVGYAILSGKYLPSGDDLLFAVTALTAYVYLWVSLKISRFVLKG